MDGIVAAYADSLKRPTPNRGSRSVARAVILAANAGGQHVEVQRPCIHCQISQAIPIPALEKIIHTTSTPNATTATGLMRLKSSGCWSLSSVSSRAIRSCRYPA
jgi:hypothetical protein